MLSCFSDSTKNPDHNFKFKFPKHFQTLFSLKQIQKKQKLLLLLGQKSYKDSGKSAANLPTQKASLQKGRCKTRQLYQYLHRFFQEWASSLSSRRHECLKKRVTPGWAAERQAALGARAAGILPPIPFLHFSWSFTQEAGGQQGTEGSWEEEWEQHHKLHVLLGVLNPVWHVPLLTNLHRARPVFHTAALCREAASALLKHFSAGIEQV